MDKKTYKVVEAKLVFSLLSCPSRATPRRSRFVVNVGIKYITFCNDEPGLIGHPSLQYHVAYHETHCGFQFHTLQGIDRIKTHCVSIEATVALY